MHYSYSTRGVCAQKINFDIVDNKLCNISFEGGCNGNLKAISKLCEGKSPSEIANLLQGNQCGSKGTSCADQFSKAIKEAMGEA